MKTRIISGICMVPLLIFVYLGGWWLTALAFLVGLLGVRELYHGFEAMGVNPCRPIAYVALVCLYLIHILGGGDIRLLMLWIVAGTAACLIYGFDVEKRKPVDTTATLLGLLYVEFFSYHMVLIDQTEHRVLIWLVLLAAFGTDIMAYFSGMALGKHKLCPHLSPKKSVEGALGGVFGSMIFCGLFGYFVVPQIVWECVIIGIVGSVAAQLGDLSASALKRHMGIKDYGNLIPGHGGIMDRFDSVLFTAPFIYYCMVFLLYQ